jgi:hypothetical protein
MMKKAHHATKNKQLKKMTRLAEGERLNQMVSRICSVVVISLCKERDNGYSCNSKYHYPNKQHTREERIGIGVGEMLVPDSVQEPIQF